MEFVIFALLLSEQLSVEIKEHGAKYGVVLVRLGVSI
jgi:hypothetical protein